MSSDNASSAVTYTSVSSDSNGPASWGIPLLNAGELLEMDPHEEPKHPEYHSPSDDDIQVEDQPYADDASLTAESPGYIADSDSMKEDTDEDSIDYPDEPEDGEEDDDEDPEEDPSEDHEPEDDDNNDDTDDEDKEPTEEEEEHPALTDSSVVPVVDPVPLVGDTEAFETDESAPTPRSPLTRVLFFPDTTPRFVLTAPPPGYDVAESSVAAARAPRHQYDFVDTVVTGQGLIRSPSHDARTIARAADRAEDVGYVRALQISGHRMMTSIKEVNLRRPEDAYETELHEVRQAYLSSEARNKALLARLETLETHMSRMEWQRQRAEDDAVRQRMVYPIGLAACSD
ncbi:hypothetical protein Tco_0700837 [Tanacetum coccineum]